MATAHFILIVNAEFYGNLPCRWSGAREMTSEGDEGLYKDRVLE